MRFPRPFRRPTVAAPASHPLGTRRRPLLFLALLALSACMPARAMAQAGSTSDAAGAASTVALPDVRTAPVRGGPLTLDGLVDEEAWMDAPVLHMTQHWPDFGADRTDRTHYRVVHDADHLWISGVFRDAPEDIRGISLYRDRWNGDDAAEVLIDANLDGTTGLFFSTTPLGVRIDGEVRNDAADSGGVEPYNENWNGFWEARSAIIDGGWSFEIRIPYETLGLRREGEGVTSPRIGVVLSRHHAVGEHRDIFPAIRPDWSRAHLKPSLAHALELPAAEPGLPLFATPYVLTGADRTRDLQAAEPTVPETVVPFEVGGEVRVGVGSGLTLDLTVNTDFAQAESDDLQVNLNRFNLFFPEKRQFFQERAANFDVQIGREVRLFHSRTIGLDDEGRPRRVWGGGRLVGSVAGWDVGALSLQVDGAEPGASENDAVLRLSRGVGPGHSRIGGIVTSRWATGGERAFTFGADGALHLGDDDYLTLQGALSSTRGDSASTHDRTVLRAFWERRRIEGFSWALDAVRAGPDFDPALGFQARDAFSSGTANLFYARRREGDSALSRWRFMATTRGYWRSGSGSVESALQRLRKQLFFRNGFFWNTAVNFTYENLRAPLQLPGASVPAGSYRGLDLFTNVDLPRSLRFGGTAVLHVGTAFDGWRARLTVSPRLNFSRHLTVRPELQIQRLHFPDRDQIVRADHAGLRLQAALDTRFSAETFLQYNRAADRMAANVRIRYHRGEGRDVYLVYEGVRDLDALLDPARRAAGRTDGRLLLKVTHTVRW